MKRYSRNMLLLTSLIVGSVLAAELNQILELKDAARFWISYHGYPEYYTSAKSVYRIDNQSIKSMSTYNSDVQISLSPNGEYRLFSLLQGLDEVKEGQRYSDYYVHDEHDQLLYTVNRGTAADLKPYVAAISDHGVLALADPVKAIVTFYKAGKLIAEGQLYEDDGDMSLERNILMQWVGEQCYILLERPGFNGGLAGNSLFIRINADGREQLTQPLPFSYLQKFVFQNNRFFISGYNYSAKNQQMQPIIVEVSSNGLVLWNNENFGHELVMSENGAFLAALSSHEQIQLFDLKQKRVEQINFDHENKVCLGLTVNNQGQLALIRVAVDFFAKRNTHFAQVYFPRANKVTDIQIDPRFSKLFQIHTDGDRFYVGSNYEWLEIAQ
ncbi:MAG: hypothetical protein HQ507_07430 [Candidatus Marinimicrobia bacterium]|nr:hypothetical protein [Candidatus Neomarinimicrobiota bacterium]